MLFDDPELATFRDLRTAGLDLPADPENIPLWLTRDQLESQHDHLIVDLHEWQGSPDLTVPAWHVAELGQLMHQTTRWARQLTETGHHPQAEAMAKARSSVNQALYLVSGTYTLLAGRGGRSPGNPGAALAQMEKANLQARNVLTSGAAQLSHDLNRLLPLTDRVAAVVSRAAILTGWTPPQLRPAPPAPGAGPAGRRSR
ncbi:hypothetical protein ASE03_12275 [Kitasatospora sp. Root187]|nr:hypothetical protein ASE03_12275 [Kitasatospora sp. Root187]